MDQSEIEEKEIEDLLPEEMSLMMPLGYNLACRAWGPVDASVKVLALHGWLDNAATFDRLAPFLTQEDQCMLSVPARVVCLDFGGHGLSDHNPRRSYSNAEHVRDVIHVIRELGWPSCSVIGHSMGGQVALMAAGIAPALFTSVVIVDALPFPIPEDKFPLIAAAAIEQTGVRHRKKARIYQTVDDCVDRLYETSVWKLSQEACEVLLARGTCQADGGGYRFRHDLAIKQANLGVISLTALAATFKQISAPVLFIEASDGVAPRAAAGKGGWNAERHEAALTALRAIPTLTTATLDGPHHLHLEAPETTARLAADFLTKHGMGKSKL